MIGTLGLYYKIYTLSPRLDLFISNLTTPDLKQAKTKTFSFTRGVGDLGVEWNGGGTLGSAV